MRLLAVEDEHKAVAALKKGLTAEYYDVVLARTGEKRFFRLTQRSSASSFAA
jgi:DNA-binding response OmpR family regulator